jgi:hypothetical protein
MHLATLAATIGILDAFSVPGCYIVEGIISALSWLFLIATWCVWAIAAFMTGRLLRRWQWAVTPIMGMLIVALLWFEAPLDLRFAISRSSLTRLAQQAIAAGPKPLLPWGAGTVKRAGAYDVIVAKVTPTGEVDFIVPGTFFFRSCSGFTYCPTHAPIDPEGSFEPLGGPWYTWHTSW